MNEENQRAVAGTLTSLETITRALSEPEAGVADLPGSMNSTLAEIQATVTDLRGMLKDASPGLNSGLANVERAWRELSRASFSMASSRAAVATERLNDWVTANDREMQEFVGDGLGQVPALITDIREAVREMENLLADIRRDPSGIIYQAPDDAVPVEED